MTRSVKSSEVPLETFSKVVEAIYDCALDPTRWQDTIRLIAELCRSQVCIIGVMITQMGVASSPTIWVMRNALFVCMKKSMRQ